MTHLKSSMYVGIVCLAALCSVAFGQSYREVKVDGALANQKDALFNSIRSGNVNADELETFLKSYYLGRWTVVDNARDLHVYRSEAQNDFASLPAEAKAAFGAPLVKILTSYAANKECYPACRYNAVLTLGMLDETPATGETPSVPYAGVLKRLCDFCDSDKIPLPDYVRLGALVGIVRHASCGIKDETMKTAVESLLLKILTPNYAKEKNYRKDIMSWFRLKAMEGLIGLKSAAGPKGPNEVLDAFVALINDKKESVEVRCLAARGIGALDLSAVQNFDFITLSEDLAKLTRDFCSEELNYIGTEALRDQIKGGSSTSGSFGGGMMGGGMGGGMDPMGSPTQTMDDVSKAKVENIIARIKFDLDSANQAIAAVKPVLTAEQQDSIDLLDETLAEIKKTMNYLDNGPDAVGATPTTKPTSRAVPRKKQAAGPTGPKVDIPMIKTHLEDQVILYNELLGIPSY
ncbi:MAG: hypothetical protein Q4G68_08510 [Planctomycetia bacterium]|nr:hypothetical protein [Planctomycetia bacterium]